MIEFTDGAFGAQHAINKRAKEGEIHDDLGMVDAQGTPIVYDSNNLIPLEDRNKWIVKEEDFLNEIKYKHLDVEASNNKSIIDIKDHAKLNTSFGQSGGEDGGAFSLESRMHTEFTGNFENAEGGTPDAIRDFASRNMHGRFYSTDVMGKISTSTYKQLLGDKFDETIDVNEDGIISLGEAENLSEQDINAVYRPLVNPQNPTETALAVEEAANWLTGLAKEQFAFERKLITDKEEKGNLKSETKKTYFNFPWKTYETPNTQAGGTDKAFVQGVINKNEQITIGANVFEKEERNGEWTGKYKQTRAKAVTIKGERVEQIGRPLTRTELIQRYSNLYGNIPNKHYDKEDGVTSTSDYYRGTTMQENFGTNEVNTEYFTQD
jgi:hypothetical protein